jgi:hypothetical protein
LESPLVPAGADMVKKRRADARREGLHEVDGEGREIREAGGGQVYEMQ